VAVSGTYLNDEYIVTTLLQQLKNQRTIINTTIVVASKIYLQDV
jgi:hypothetical protein